MLSRGATFCTHSLCSTVPNPCRLVRCHICVCFKLQCICFSGDHYLIIKVLIGKPWVICQVLHTLKKNLMSLNLFLFLFSYFKYSFTALYCICLFKLFLFLFFSPESFEGLRTRSCRENGQLRLPPECKRRKGGQTPQHSETSAGQVRGRMWLLLLHRGEGNHEVSVTLTILSFTPSRSLKG